MISSSRRQIFHPDRGFLHLNISSRGFSPGEPIPPVDKIYEWREPAVAGHHWTADAVDRFLADPNCPIDQDGIIVVPFAACSCCGHEDSRWVGEGIYCVADSLDAAQRQYRCFKHRERNPCAITGCKRTVAARGYFSTEVWMCGEHWKMACPPGSPLRRINNRLFRLKKKRGEWTRDLNARYWRAWAAIVRRGRSMAAGDIDMNEINKLFGWEDE